MKFEYSELFVRNFSNSENFTLYLFLILMIFIFTNIYVDEIKLNN